MGKKKVKPRYSQSCINKWDASIKLTTDNLFYIQKKNMRFISCSFDKF